MAVALQSHNKRQVGINQRKTTHKHNILHNF